MHTHISTPGRPTRQVGKWAASQKTKPLKSANGAFWPPEMWPTYVASIDTISDCVLNYDFDTKFSAKYGIIIFTYS